MKHIQSKHIIRFTDCDPAGHLNNAKYVEYFLNAREDHVKTRYNLALSEFYKEGRAWVVHSHKIQYAMPVEHGTEVVIYSSIINCSNQGMVVEFWMTDVEGKLIFALMQTQFVYVDMKSLKKINHEESLMELLSGSVENTDLKTSLQRRMLLRLSELRNEV